LLDGFGPEVSTVDVRTSELSLEQAENNLENSLRQVVVGVVADYYGLLKAGLILEERQQSLERSREQARAVKIRREEGQVADLDVLQAELKVAQNENQLLSARNDLNASRIAFRLRLGLASDVDVDIEPIDVAFATREYSFQESANYALAHRLDVHNQQLSREQSRLQLVRARNRKLPNLDLSASYDFRDSDGRLKDVWDFDQGQVKVVALFQMPLGDVSDEVRLRRAEYTLEQAEISLEQLQQQVVGEVDKEIRRIRTLQNQVLSLRKNVELAEENYRLSRMSFEIGGLISSFDLANAMDDLTVARTSYVSALIDYRIALANLDLVRGVELIPLIQEQIERTQVTSAE
jgi:outer membrane protein TolC